jgi:hypothetical protein
VMTRRVLSAATAMLAVAALDSCRRGTRSAPAASIPSVPRSTSVPKKRTAPAPNPGNAPSAEATPSPVRSRTEPPAGGLGEMVPYAEREETNRHIDAALYRARKNLAVLANRSLTAEQTKTLERVDILSRQAREARADNDLVNAKNLADRAEVLSQDLLKALK